MKKTISTILSSILLSACMDCLAEFPGYFATQEQYRESIQSVDPADPASLHELVKSRLMLAVLENPPADFGALLGAVETAVASAGLQEGLLAESLVTEFCSVRNEFVAGCWSHLSSVQSVFRMQLAMARSKELGLSADQQYDIYMECLMAADWPSSCVDGFIGVLDLCTKGDQAIHADLVRLNRKYTAFFADERLSAQAEKPLRKIRLMLKCY